MNTVYIKRIIITWLIGFIGDHYYLPEDFKHGLIYTFTVDCLELAGLLIYTNQ